MTSGPSFSGSTRRGGNPWMVRLSIAVVVALVALAVLKPWAGPGAAPSGGAAHGGSVAAARPSTGSPSPSAGTPTQALAAAPPEPLPVAFRLPSAPASGAWTGLRWRQLAPDDPLTLVTGMVHWRGGFVAIGSQAGAPATPVWTSTDGRSWQPLIFDTSTTFWPGISVLSVAEVPSGLAAVTEIADYCTEPCTPTYLPPVISWTSPDGRSWTPHPLPASWLPGVDGAPPLSTDGPSGLLVASAGYGAQLASTADGVHWSLEPPGRFPSRFALDALTGTSTGYVAVGSWTTNDGRSRAATLWSPDGRTWPSAPTLLPDAPSSSAGSTVVSLLGGSRGLIVSGRDGSVPDTIIWWQSADGRAWHALRDYPPLGPDTGCQGEGCGLAPVGVLSADGDRILGTLPSASLVCYISLDGGTWDPLSMAGDVPDGGPLTMALLPGGVLATNGRTSWYGEALVG